MNLVPLSPEREACRASVIEILEETLQQARDGNVVAISIAIVRPDQAANSKHSQCDCTPALVGALNLALARLLSKMV